MQDKIQVQRIHILDLVDHRCYFGCCEQLLQSARTNQKDVLRIYRDSRLYREIADADPSHSNLTSVEKFLHVGPGYCSYCDEVPTESWPSPQNKF